MACALTINSVANNNGIIIVQGNLQIFTFCNTGPFVTVDIQCGTSSISVNATLTQLTANLYSYLASGVVKCSCDDPINITVTNNCQNYSCQNTFNGTLCCCPDLLNFSAAEGLCNANHLREVTFDCVVDVPTSCTSTFQIDYGDGNLSPQYTFSSGQYSIQDTHAYATNFVYTATLKTIYPIGCNEMPIKVEVSKCPPCNTRPILNNLCKYLEPFLIIFGAIWAVLMLTLFGSMCSIVQPLLSQITFGFLLSFIFILLIMFALCRKCICAFLIKIPGQILIITGLTLLMFTVFPCCMTPTPFSIPSNALIASILLVLIGFLILLFAWYRQFRKKCPLSICDFWITINTTLIYAFIVSIIVYLILLTGVSFVGLGVSLTTITLFLVLSTNVLNYNQGQGLC